MILITGATGIVGSHILIELLKKGEKVRVLKRRNASTEAIGQLLAFHKITPENIEYAEGDINDIVSLDDALKGCHTVYHCAAMVSFHPADAEALFRINILGTKNMVDGAINHGIKTFAYISSTAAIGDQLINGMQSEASTWTDDKGKSHYRLSKHHAEREVWRGAQEGLNVVIVNPTHFAVALQYKSGDMNAPMVVAKGVDFLAQKIKEIAAINDVPIIENPPLARELYKFVDIDQEVPERLFKAVAEVLAYVYSLKKKSNVY